MKPLWMRETYFTAWAEDDALTNDRERMTPGNTRRGVEKAWEQLYGEPLDIKEMLGRYDAESAEFFLMPGNRIVVLSMPGYAEIRTLTQCDLCALNDWHTHDRETGHVMMPVPLPWLERRKSG